MSRRLSLRLPRRREPEVLREGEIYTQDFHFVVLDEDASQWDRLKARVLYRLGRLRPPD